MLSVKNQTGFKSTARVNSSAYLCGWTGAGLTILGDCLSFHINNLQLGLGRCDHIFWTSYPFPVSSIILALVSAAILLKNGCQLYICTFAFSTSAYLGITFWRTCTFVSTLWWCPWWAFSECLVLRQKMTWPKPVSVMVLAVHGSLGQRGC